jgi:hypothetical protein
MASDLAKHNDLAKHVSIVLIETNGTIKTLKTKEVSNETLYKKCGFRVSDDFLCRHTWQVKLQEETYFISLWGKKTGKANFENKYDLPPPLDKDLFFGTCAIVRTSEAAKASEAASSATSTFLDLTKETWLKIYEHLFGGFEDIGEEDEFSEDELADVDPALLTKHGYLKDDFVIDSGEVSPVIESDSDNEVVKIKPKKKAAAVSKAPVSKAPVKTKKTVSKAKKEEEEEEEELAEDTSELEEEVYTFSDDD